MIEKMIDDEVNPDKNRYYIRHMQREEIQLAIDWARAEGWNPGLNDAKCFYAADPKGFFIGLLDDEPICVGSAVCYDEKFAFCGLYIVKPGYRHQNFGIELTHQRLNYVGDRITGLDGVLNMTHQYEKLGYQAAHLNTRFQLTVPTKMEPPSSSALIPLTDIPFSQISTYDRELFPAPRELFLHGWISEPTHVSVGYYNLGKLEGYSVMRRCFQGFKIGPLFANNTEIANQLLRYLLSKIPREIVYLDIPEVNQESLQLAQEFNMKPGFQTLRMYRNGIINLDTRRVYGITTCEMG